MGEIITNEQRDAYRKPHELNRLLTRFSSAIDSDRFTDMNFNEYDNNLFLKYFWKLEKAYPWIGLFMGSASIGYSIRPNNQTETFFLTTGLVTLVSSLAYLYARSRPFTINAPVQTVRPPEPPDAS
jgi:hypothetical protein